jgi:transposase InsO family protein
MSKAQLVITAVVLEGRSKTAVARDYGLSRYWVHQLVSRYHADGAAAFEPRSRRPHHQRHAVSAEIEDRIVRLRKSLSKQGYDAGAATIAEHLTRDPTVTKVPALSTIWRILSRRGFITAQPHKRPRSAWKRFCAEQPNELWQADVTHWRLADDTEVEILNILDDHSRLLLASRAYPTVGGHDVVETFTDTIARFGTPAAVLTDNGAIFTATPRRGGRTALQVILAELGTKYVSSRPYHPQTCGKVERLHQTLKNASPPPRPHTRLPNCRPCSTNSAPTTTPSGPTAPSPDAHPCKHLTPGPKPSPPPTTARRTTGSATTESTPPAPSPSATTAACTTSGCPNAAAAPTSSC